MSWNYKRPIRSDYDTDEEYEEAVEAYDYAEDEYIDMYVEMRQLANE